MIPRLTPAGCRARRERLLEKSGLDYILISNPRHVYYYSGYLASELSLAAWGPCYLLIERGNIATLLVHNFGAAAAREASADKLSLWTWYDAEKRAGLPIWKAGAEALATLLGTLTVGNTHSPLGVEAGSFPAGVLPDGLTSRDLTTLILSLRRSKDPDELAAIESLVRLTGCGHEEARAVLAPGVTETEVYAAILKRLTIEAGEAVNLICDLISGPRAFTGVGSPTSRVIGQSDPVIVDLNPYIAGYRADYTATLLLAEELSPRYRQLEAALHRAIDEGEQMLHPGIRAGDVFTAVKDAIDSNGFSGCFQHHAGHGIGLGHPEAPYFVPESDEVLCEGDVVTLEPGAYGDDFGARIEHNYLIEASGPRRLSSHDTRFLLHP
jgi:Xaa-Pro aminopeptidase